jgi:hypothetical protein
MHEEFFAGAVADVDEAVERLDRSADVAGAGGLTPGATGATASVCVGAGRRRSEMGGVHSHSPY